MGSGIVVSSGTYQYHISADTIVSDIIYTNLYSIHIGYIRSYTYFIYIYILRPINCTYNTNQYCMTQLASYIMSHDQRATHHDQRANSNIKFLTRPEALQASIISQTVPPTSSSRSPEGKRALLQSARKLQLDSHISIQYTLKYPRVFTVSNCLFGFLSLPLSHIHVYTSKYISYIQYYFNGF